MGGKDSTRNRRHPGGCGGHPHRSRPDRPRRSGREGDAAIFEPRAAVLHPVDVENPLLRAAVGDYADEAAVLLLINLGHWLAQLQSAGLISLVPDDDGPWARIDWPELDAALCSGSLLDSSDELGC